MIDARTKLLGVIGDPIEHSRSPQLHNYLIKHLNLNFCYLAFKAPPAQLARLVDGFRAMDVAGFNVTVPHKETIASLLDGLSQDADTLGAVNTVVVENEKFVGHNTDWIGFLHPLSKIDLQNQRAVVLGAGGAAKGIIYGLIQKGIDQLILVNRTTSKAEALAAHVQERFGFDAMTVVESESEALKFAIQDAQLLVNTTSVGMWPEVEQSPVESSMLHPELMVYDLVYNPLETQLLKEAKQVGARTIDGLGMFIGQGVAAFSKWTKAEVPASLVHSLRDYLIQL